MSNVLKKIIALLLLVSLCAGMLGGTGISTVSADEEEDELREKISELEEELEKLKQQIAEAKDAAAEAKERSATYKARAAIVKEQIDTLRISVDLKNKQLAIKQQELDNKQLERQETYDLFKQRLKAMYMNNNVSYLSLILGADTFSEFLVAAKTQIAISKHDTALVDKLDRETKEIEAAKEVIEKELKELEDDMAVLKAKYNEMAALYREADAAMTEAEAEQKAHEEDYAEIEAEYAKAKEELDELMGRGVEEYVGEPEGFIWPVPGYSYISSYFGWRILRGAPNWHTGIDIAGSRIYGKPVVASNSGYCVRVRYYTTGYGYHVMIDHGDNSWTVYGHMSELLVHEGQWVNQGDVIGKVGSTGNSTGPHLHFEIRIDGVQVNPLDYVQRP